MFYCKYCGFNLAEQKLHEVHMCERAVKTFKDYWESLSGKEDRIKEAMVFARFDIPPDRLPDILAKI